MTQTFDTILKSGTVVNQDGEGVRDIGISGGRVTAIVRFSRSLPPR
jgi:dihydroorotase